MTRSRAYYSLVQYCPDPFRAEAANVGVVLLCPDRLYFDARTVRGADRPSRFFGRSSVDRDALEAAKTSFENAVKRGSDRVRTQADFQNFLGRFGNALTFTAPRQAIVEDPTRELAELFRELVGGRSSKTRRKRNHIPELDAVFDRFSESTRAKRDQSYVLPRTELRIEVPYAYQNGRLNLIRPARFDASEGAALKRAEALLFEGRCLEEEIEGKPRQIIVAVPGRAAAESQNEARVARLFDVMKQEFVMSSRVQGFAGDVEKLLASHERGR